jgi:hypothetical protein
MMKNRNVYRVKYFACLIIGLLVIPAIAAAEGTDVGIRYFAGGKKVNPLHL